jgi:adenosine kinase
VLHLQRRQEEPDHRVPRRSAQLRRAARPGEDREEGGQREDRHQRPEQHGGHGQVLPPAVADGHPRHLRPGPGAQRAHDQFTEILSNSQAFISNEHELEGVTKRFGEAARKAIDKLDWVITTRGSSGSTVKEKGKVTELPIAKAKSVVDPTGAGDSFRGALLYGITRGLNVVQSARLGVVIGSLKVEHAGGQLPSLDDKEFKRRYKETFGDESPL